MLNSRLKQPPRVKILCQSVNDSPFPYLKNNQQNLNILWPCPATANSRSSSVQRPFFGNDVSAITSWAPDAVSAPLFVWVLVKCRQNVANKLFITRVFNPVHPHTCNKLIAISVLLNTQTKERSLMPKRGRHKLFLSVEVQNLHTILL